MEPSSARPVFKFNENKDSSGVSNEENGGKTVSWEQYFFIKLVKNWVEQVYTCSVNFFWSDAYLGSCQTFMMKVFAKYS